MNKRMVDARVYTDDEAVVIEQGGEGQEEPHWIRLMPEQVSLLITWLEEEAAEFEGRAGDGSS